MGKTEQRSWKWPLHHQLHYWLPARRDRRRLIEHKGWERVKRYVSGCESNWVCVWIWKRGNVYECKGKRREMEDIIWSYWKAKEKVISHAAHLPVCLKGLSARMINKLDKRTHTVQQHSLFFYTHTCALHASCGLCGTILFLAKILWFGEEGSDLSHCSHKNRGNKCMWALPKLWRVIIIIQSVFTFTCHPLSSPHPFALSFFPPTVFYKGIYGGSKKCPEHFNVLVFGIVTPPALAQTDKPCIAGKKKQRKRDSPGIWKWVFMKKK